MKKKIKLDAERKDLIQRSIDMMGINQIEKMKNKYNIGFVIRRTPLKAYNLIYSNDMYYVYML